MDWKFNWDFSSGSGVQLVDQSSNANNGAITGAAWAIDSPNQSPMDENSFSQLCTATGGEYSENSCVISTTNYWNYRLNLNEYCEMDSTGEYSYCGTLQLSPTEATITISDDDGCMIVNCSR